MKHVIKFLPVIAILILSYWAIAPLFASGFFPIHDDTQVARVSEMKDALADGNFPVRWVENLGYGYGYPIFNFYAPLAYYVGGFFNLIGFDSLISTKIMIGLATVLAGVSMYLLAKEFWGRIGGLVSGLLYLYAPYHALNIYVRGAFAELWAYAFIPFVFLGLYKIYKISVSDNETNKKTKVLTTTFFSQSHARIWIGITALSYAAIILSHNLTALMVTPFIFLFTVTLAIFAKKRGRSKIYLLPLSLVVGLALAAFYWLPVIFEMQYTNVLSVVGGGSDYKDHFVCLSQFWNSPWAYGGSIPGCMDGLSFKIGKLHIVLGLLAIVPLIILKKNKRLLLALILGFAGLFLAFFLVLEQSKFIWDAIPQMAFLQFPWRFLVLVNFFIAFISGALLVFLPSRLRIIAGILLIVAVILVNFDVFVPSSIIARTNANYIDKATIQWETSKISDEYMPQGFQKPKTEKEIPKEKVVVDKKVAKLASINQTTANVEVIMQATEPIDMRFNIAYYPSWHVYIDNQPVDFKNTSTGLLVTVPEGKHTIRAALSSTPVQQVGNLVSLTGVLVLFAGIITHRKDKKKIAKST